MGQIINFSLDSSQEIFNAIFTNNTPSKIALAGKIGSGKSTIAKGLSKYLAYPIISFGEIIKKYSEKSGTTNNRESLQSLGQSLIEKFGADGFIDWTIKNSSGCNWDAPLIIDGFRHLLAYQRFNQLFPNNKLIYCYCSPDDQITRIVQRDNITKKEAQKIISHATENDIGELEQFADFIFK